MVGNNVQINNAYSNYSENISGVPQGSMLAPILFNLSINELLFFIEIVSMHNFADDNTLSAWIETVFKLINTLELKRKIAIDQLQETKRLLIQINTRSLQNKNPIWLTFRLLLIITLSAQFHQQNFQEFIWMTSSNLFCILETHVGQLQTNAVR